MDSPKEIDPIEIINKELEQYPQLQLPMGIKAIKTGIYWLRVYRGKDLLK